MCLGIPGMVTSIGEAVNGLAMGRVDFGGIEREVCLGFTPEVRVGDYVLVHVGFALSVLDSESAQQILSDLAEIEQLGAEASSSTKPPAQS
jgi:hydrogenase expression/formation protein HypC